MNKKLTSFGSMEDILKLDNNKVVAEFLIFEKEGRKHKHLEYESFAVLTGEGQVVSGDQIFDVKPGDVVRIPPKTLHWMIPKEGQTMTGILWYHEKSGNYLTGENQLKDNTSLLTKKSDSKSISKFIKKPYKSPS